MMLSYRNEKKFNKNKVETKNNSNIECLSISSNYNCAISEKN